MDLKEFERKVLAGEITDFEPYFLEQYDSNQTDQYDQMDRRYILAKNGIETDRVATMDGYNIIMDIINEGLLPERYEEWKHYPRAGVRQALADNGYFWDYFINDEDPYIRQSIIETDLRLGLQRLDDDEDRQIIQTTLLQKTNDELELDILKAYIEAEKEYLAHQALALKYEALTTVPSTIEKTMTPAQLFAVESPLWALDYEPDKIKQMINHLQNYPKSEEIFNIVLEEVSNGIIAINKFGATI